MQVSRDSGRFRGGAAVRIRAMQNMTPAMRRALKAQAHALKPVVMIGNDGLTPAVLAEVERALKSHELIKIRVFGDDRDARLACLAEMCAHTGAIALQHIGKILVIHRANPEPAPVAKRTVRSKPRTAPSSRAQPASRWRGVASTRGAPPTSAWTPGRKRKSATASRSPRPAVGKGFAGGARLRSAAKPARRRPQ